MIRCHKCSAVLNTCNCDWPEPAKKREVEMNWKQQIEAQIASLREKAEDDNICGVDIGRTGSCNASWVLEEAADSLQALLDVAVAAETILGPEAEYHPRGNLNALKEKLDKLREGEK